MFQYWSAIKTSTWFKLVVATAISYVLYSMAGFLLPILLAIGLAFGLYPLVNMISQVRVAHGMIQLSRAVAIVLALIGFLLFITIAIAFKAKPKPADSCKELGNRNLSVHVSPFAVCGLVPRRS